MAPDFTGVVVAAGDSSRFGGSVPKPYLPLAGRTVLERSIAALAGHDAVGGVIVVVAPDELDGARADEARRLPGVAQVVAGGATRSESVERGIEAGVSTDYLLVHDAARPMAGPRLVDAVIRTARRHGAAVPVIEIPDTVKRLEREWIVETVDRSSLCRAQTPQGFRADWLRAALARARSAGHAPTDEATALEADGRRVAAVPGHPDNRKITTPDDLEAAERRLCGDVGSLRVGTGFDVHRTDPARPLVLGGLRFPGEPGLAGHSDADVVLHAAMDAILGAAALGDIGEHFPPEDEAWAGADSADLARRVAGLIAQAGFEIVNLDLTLLAESPRIRAYRDRMRASIGECLAVSPGRVGLKATTLEGLGSLGRGEGAACQATALLRATRG